MGLWLGVTARELHCIGRNEVQKYKGLVRLT